MNFRDALQQKILVFDGATGTMVQNLGLGDEDFGGSDFKMLTDLLVFSKPEAQKDIHLAYFRAGANCVETNTFGASPFRMTEFDFKKLDTSKFEKNPFDFDYRTVEPVDFSYYLNVRAAQIACEARDEYRKDPKYDGRPLFVVGSIGPSNRVISSSDANLATASFAEIMDNFDCQVRGLIDGGADVLLFETQQDILELKAGIMGAQRARAAKKSDIAIMAQVTVDAFCKMQIFNTDIHAAQVTLDGIGIDTFGINCSIGPDLMAKTVETMSRYSPLTISVIPNAGLPVSEDGQTVFKFPPDKMADYLGRYSSELGVGIVGGCCGTTPDHIAAIAEAVAGKKPMDRTKRTTMVPGGGVEADTAEKPGASGKRTAPVAWVSGPQNAIKLDSSEGLIRIGERLNLRGSKKAREAVENEEGVIHHHVLEEIIEEQVNELGCGVIDVCMDSNVVDTLEVLREVVHKQTTNFAGAMCIDSFDHHALIAAIEVYPGRPILNSFSMEEVEPGVSKVAALAKATAHHCPMYIGLCADGEGPGATREKKAAIAQRMVEEAGKYGVNPDQIMVDMNVFPVGSESEEGMNFALESLEAIPLIKAIHPDLMTTCGVGNLTNGLASKPYMRTVLTSVWLDEARKRGLDAAIINPNHYLPVDSFDKDDYELARRIILERDMDAYDTLEEIAVAKTGAKAQKRSTYDDLDDETAICEKVKDGKKDRGEGVVEFRGLTYEYKDKIVPQVARVLERHEPLEFVNKYLMTAMNELGDAFGRGDVSLPHVLKSADVMKHVMGFIEAYIKHSSGGDMHAEIEYKGTIVIGTVYQDVHSIGKDLAKTLLENYGYRVIDLGVMVQLQDYLDAAKEHKADAIGMSALLVQTSNHMITVSKMMADQNLAEIPILIGGAPVSDRHAAYVAMAGEEDVERMRPNVFYCSTAMDGVNAMNRWTGDDDRVALLEKNRVKLLDQFEKATKKAAKDTELLATLPRREISFDGHPVPQDAWMPPTRIAMSVAELAPQLDRRTLYALNWKFGGTKKREKTGYTNETLDALFDEWVAKCTENGWLQPQGVCGIFPCQSDGDDEVIVYDPADLSKEIARFTLDVVIGSGRKDIISGAQYFRTKESGEFDAIGLQIATCGQQVDDQLEKFRAEHDSESQLFLQGMSDRCAEDLAEHLHNLMRQRLGYANGQGTRWSPGYPAISNTDFNRPILDQLRGEETIGVRLTDAGEFFPTGSTAAIVCFHPDARYT